MITQEMHEEDRREPDRPQRRGDVVDAARGSQRQHDAHDRVGAEEDATGSPTGRRSCHQPQRDDRC